MQRRCGSWPGWQGRHMVEVTSVAPDFQVLLAQAGAEGGRRR